MVQTNEIIKECAWKKQYETSDLLIRKATFEDTKDMYRNIWSRNESAKDMLWMPCISLEEAYVRMEKTIAYQQNHAAYIICEKKSGEAIGFAGFTQVEHGIYEDTGIAFGPDYVGKGYGTQLMEVFCAFIFYQLNSKKIIYSCRNTNEASKRLALHCGFHYSHSKERIDARTGDVYQLNFYEMKIYIPEAIRAIVGNGKFTVDSTGMSLARVICFEDTVLKIEPYGEETEHVRKMLEWLSGKLPVPEILHYEEIDGIAYLLMSRIKGAMACDEELMEHPTILVKNLAKGLKGMWKVPIDGCPYPYLLADRLSKAEYRVKNGLCDIENAEAGTFGKDGFANPEELLLWLKTHVPKEDFVLCHGDYCMPNIFIQDGNISGFIDLGNCGVADRYQDIALCYRSLMHNYSGTYGGKVYGDFNPDLLFDELRIEPDWDKIRYYILLDELF